MTPGSPRVSVIVAARDAAATIAETLASVAAQEYDDWEVVVADDSSVDGTGEIAAAFGERVRVIRTDGPLGPGPARNLAVSHARGELLATLDADDAWLPSFLAEQISLYERGVASGRPVGLVACDARLRGPDGKERGTFGDLVGRPDEVTLTWLLRRNVIFTSVLMPREIFIELGGYDGRLVGAEDHDLWLRVVQRGYEVAVNPRALAIYRLSPGGLSADSGKIAVVAGKVYEIALERGGLSPSQRRLVRRQMRLYRVIAERARIAAEREGGRRAVARRLKAAPSTALVAMEHPGRWLGWIRNGGPRASGSGRHA